jgi:hypothetical protein
MAAAVAMARRGRGGEERKNRGGGGGGGASRLKRLGLWGRGFPVPGLCADPYKAGGRCRRHGYRDHVEGPPADSTGVTELRQRSMAVAQSQDSIEGKCLIRAENGTG